MTETANIADDILEGAAAIADYIGKTERQAEHLLATRKIPAFKLGGTWHLRKSTFRAFIAELETKAMKAA